MVRTKLWCAECGERVGVVDHSYRKGDTEEIVERWVCFQCDKEIYDEAVSQIP